MAGRDLQFEHPPDSMVLEKRLAEAAAARHDTMD